MTRAGRIGYSKKQVSKLSQLTPRQVQFYVEQGVVKADVDQGSGRGKVRRFSTMEVFYFCIIKELFGFGMTVGAIRSCIEKMRKYGIRPGERREIEFPERRWLTSDDTWTTRVSPMATINIETGQIMRQLKEKTHHREAGE